MDPDNNKVEPWEPMEWDEKNKAWINELCESRSSIGSTLRKGRTAIRSLSSYPALRPGSHVDL